MKKNTKTKHIGSFIIVGVLFVLIVFIYAYIIHSKIIEHNFITSCEKIYETNKQPVFRIDKILLYSSADATNDSNENDLQNLNISQYTDIAININNTQYLTDITEKNSIKELYIDNITIDIDPKYDDLSLDYKNPLNFGKYNDINHKVEDNNRIDFSIIYNNSQNDEANYSNPTFYTDCSNPISLGFINNNVVTGFSLEENNNLDFNGSILKQANVDINSLNFKLSFTIHIKNNLNENYTYNMTIDNTMDKIEEGYLYKRKNCSKKKNEYIFFRES